MTEANGFWIIPDIAAMRTPLSIMKEQAAALTTATQGLLRGEVGTTQTQSNELNIALNIVVPALGNYRYLVAQYGQPVTMYPGSLYVPSKPVLLKVESEEQFVRLLKQHLASSEIQRVVAGLLSQARESSRNE
jgi:hypothetical protein